MQGINHIKDNSSFGNSYAYSNSSPYANQSNYVGQSYQEAKPSGGNLSKILIGVVAIAGALMAGKFGIDYLGKTVRKSVLEAGEKLIPQVEQSGKGTITNLCEHAKNEADAFISTTKAKVNEQIKNIASESEVTFNGTLQNISEQAKGTINKLIEATGQNLTKATDVYLATTSQAVNQSTEKIAGGIMNSLKTKLGRIGRLIIK